jgi:NADH-quinone oxidoreductase subunit H
VPDRKVEGPAMIEPASDYPVPPLDLVVPAQPRHRLRRRANDVASHPGTPTRLP